MAVVELLLVGTAAFVGAEGLCAVARMTVARIIPSPGPLGADRRSGDPSERRITADPVLARNPFDSIRGSLFPLAHAEESSPAPEAYDPLALPACSKVRPVVIAAFTDPEASLAAFEVEGGDAVLRRRGGAVGGSTVEYIDTDRVFVREDGKMCQAQLFASPSAAAPKERAPASPHAQAPGGALDPSLAKGIERIGPGRYRIERYVMQRVLDDQSEIFKGALIGPEKDGDRTVGVRLRAVRPDGLFGVLGLQDGDVMRTLNGYEFSSPERMLEAYARLRDATQLAVEFTRGGQTQNFTYSIQ